jgi:predicted nucleic acid-binding protein
MHYVDTSVLVAYYCPEVLSAAAGKAMNQLTQPRISVLVEVEFASALSLKTRTGELTRGDARRAMDCFQSHRVSNLYGIAPVAAAEYARAMEWLGSFDTPLRTMDALHLAIAANHDCTLLTADQVLAKVARKLQVPCTHLH